MIKKTAFLNGRWTKIENAKISVLDRGFTLGDGLFETLRIYGGKIFRLNLHLDRFWISSKAMKIALPYSLEELESILKHTVKKNNLTDGFIRITLTRGAGPANQPISLAGPPNLAIIAQTHEVLPKKYYLKGVCVILFPDTAQSTAGLKIRVKTCNYLSSIMLKDIVVKKGAFEAILLKGSNKITGGTFSNLFIVKDGIVKTPPLSRWVLSGVTRKVVLEISRKIKIKCLETNLKSEDILQSDETFLTNTRYEILPVTFANGVQIGSGKPGSFTRRLRRKYLKIVEEETLSC